MNFLEAVELSLNEKCYVRRKCWEDGVAVLILHPKSKNDRKCRYAMESRGEPYVATCHVAACELGGIRTVNDVLANDWEKMYT